MQLTLKKEKNYEVSLKLPNSFGNQYVMFDKDLSSLVHVLLQNVNCLFKAFFHWLTPVLFPSVNVKWDGLLAIFTVALVIKMVTAFTAAVTQQLRSFNACYIQIQA